MKEQEKYIEYHKRLVQAYYTHRFEEVVKELMENELKEEENPKGLIAQICGVTVDSTKPDHLFYQDLAYAITKQRVRLNVVEKVRSCEKDCESEGGKSKCQSVCPFDAIVKDGLTNDKIIDESQCISCARCIDVCDKGNYISVVQSLPVLDLLQKNEEVIAMVAPAIAGQFGEGVTLDMLREALIKLGFRDMVEVAVAADVLSMKEAFEFHEHVKIKEDVMISSCCCPMWVAALRKVYHKLIKDVSPSVSPMIAMARMIKTLNENVKVVFVGPCIAKKAEAKDADLVGDVDYVLTFTELKEVFEAIGINPNECKGIPTVEYASMGGRSYAHSGGVSEAVHEIVDQLFPEKRELWSYEVANGMRECKQILAELEGGEKRATFIEGMGCIGGCVGGPKRLVDVEVGKAAVREVAKNSSIRNPVHSDVLRELLYRIGIEELSDLKHEGGMFERRFD